ncbi:MAG: cupredoxin domain-containing protein [Candidatus Dormibacteria bacterium]
MRTRSLSLLALAGLTLAGCGSAATLERSGATFYAASPLASPSFGSGAATPAPSASAAPAVAAGQSSGLGTPAVTVAATDALKFDPASSTVAVGQVIEWKDTGTVAHNVTFDSSSDATSPTLNPGDTWEVKFSVAGTYQYHCTFHPGMDGTLTVTG